ncbi:MAG: hypothetical protein H7267_03100 [Sandarakinorhabdus sp.]|nr:hypothetical protein [Sandarakinorhabdus sp.]
MASAPQSPAPWRRVKWNRAGQLAGLADAVEALAGLNDLPPPRAFAALRDAHPEAAVRFMAQCLPRFDAILWLHKALERSPAASAGGAEIRAGIAGWLADPSDKRRRLVFECAEAIGIDNADGTAGLALFLSGGSLTPPELEQGVQPPPGAFGKAVAGTILLAGLAQGPENFNDELDTLLGIGLAIAEAEDVL